MKNHKHWDSTKRPGIEEVESMAEDHIHKTVLEERIERISDEFKEGFKFLEKSKKTVSFFGSAQKTFDHEVYREAYELAFNLSKEGFAIVTGGGPGVMEAANRGAYEAGGRSIGFTIELPEEQKTNEFVKEELPFHYFFSRKVMLSFAANAYVFFPGGFGTLDELFEMLTLIQTGKKRPTLVVLVDKGYWTPLLKWIKEILYEKNGAINKDAMDIYDLVDSAEEAFDFLKSKKKELFKD